MCVTQKAGNREQGPHPALKGRHILTPDESPGKWETMISIALFGATGRLGQEILRAADREKFSFSALVASSTNKNISQDLGVALGIGSLGVVVTAPQQSLPATEVVIDVSSPEGTTHALALCVKQRLPLL